MPADIIAAVDEIGANTLLHAAESAIGTVSDSGSGSLGPLQAGWSASASFTGGTVSLAAPDTVSIDDIEIDYSLSLTLGIDLSFLDFCLPQVCISTPWGDICTPEVCIDFPTISVTVPFSSSATLSADFGINVHLTSGTWFVDVVIQSVRELDLGAAATLLLTAIGAAISAAISAVLGPFGFLLSGALDAILGVFAVAEVTGLLGDIVSVFVSGLTFNVYKQPQNFQVLPASGPFDPAVFVTLTAVTADVQASNENELILSADI
jgi:hypothetical protein